MQFPILVNLKTTNNQIYEIVWAKVLYMLQEKARGKWMAKPSN